MTDPQQPEAHEDPQHPDAQEASAIDEAPADPPAPDAELPSTAELEEPSTEKSPDEEPKAPSRQEQEPSHQATGIGVIDDPE